MDLKIAAARTIKRLPAPIRRPIVSRFGDGLVTIHYRPFTPEFNRSYEEMASWWQDERVDVRWRMWLLLGFARAAQRADGDYAEFGVYRGGCTSMILQFVDLTGRRLHLFDTFTGIPESGLTERERDEGFAGRLAGTSLDEVRDRLAAYQPAPTFWPGDVFTTMPDADTGPLAFAHIDLNAATPTTHVLSHVLERLSPGGIVVFDDYAYIGYEEQRRAIDALGVDVLALPTGQGVLMR
jgi:hypothetical protein